MKQMVQEEKEKIKDKSEEIKLDNIKRAIKDLIHVKKNDFDSKLNFEIEMIKKEFENNGIIYKDMINYIEFLETNKISENYIITILAKNNKILCEKDLLTMKNALEYFCEKGLNSDTIGHIFEYNYKDLIKMNFEDIKENVEFLKEYKIDLNRCLLKWPNVIILKLENDIKRKIAYFEDIGLTQERICKIIMDEPSVLGLDLEDDIIQKVI